MTYKVSVSAHKFDYRISPIVVSLKSDSGQSAVQKIITKGSLILVSLAVFFLTHRQMFNEGNDTSQL